MSHCQVAVNTLWEWFVSGFILHSGTFRPFLHLSPNVVNTRLHAKGYSRPFILRSVALKWHFKILLCISRKVGIAHWALGVQWTETYLAASPVYPVCPLILSPRISYLGERVCFVYYYYYFTLTLSPLP